MCKARARGFGRTAERLTMRISLKHWLRVRRDPWRKVFYQAFRRWKADRMEPKRMVFAHLNAASVVLDVGGFEGNWAADIYERYGALVHVFEPHPRFAARLKQRFEAVPTIKVHDVALGSGEGTLSLSDDGDASSSFRASKATVLGRVVPVASVLTGIDFPQIDLVKINIEGGEYDLLPALDEAGVMARISVLQVQFHLFTPDDIARRDEIRLRLAKTHVCDWSYDFVWEQWSRRT